MPVPSQGLALQTSRFCRQLFFRVDDQESMEKTGTVVIAFYPVLCIRTLEIKGVKWCCNDFSNLKKKIICGIKLHSEMVMTYSVSSGKK